MTPPTHAERVQWARMKVINCTIHNIFSDEEQPVSDRIGDLSTIQKHCAALISTLQDESGNAT